MNCEDLFATEYTVECICVDYSYKLMHFAMPRINFYCRMHHCDNLTY
jgi:hypothetical protein